MYSAVHNAVLSSTTTFRMNKNTKRVTLSDVARQAGVSLKTASNVKNDWPYVSDETRQKVKQAMEELGYRPSHIARTLATGRSQTVGVIVPDISNPFFSAVFRGCEDALTAESYSAFLCNTDEDPQKEQYYVELLLNHGVDGLLLWGSSLDTPSLKDSVRSDLPVVSVDGLAQEAGRNVTMINVDNRGGAQAITEHLIGAGYQRIAYIAGASRRLPAQERMGGYRQALEASGLTLDPALIHEAQPTIGGGYDATRALLAAQPPDAIFCYNDLMAVGAISAAQESGVAVPDDLAIVGFDDTLPAMLVTPLLTTVRIPKHDLGTFAAQTLLKRLNKEQPLEQESSQIIQMPVELCVRDSCGTKVMTPAERQQLMQRVARSVSVNLPDSPVPPQ